jgi:hypothetical protein
VIREAWAALRALRRASLSVLPDPRAHVVPGPSMWCWPQFSPPAAESLTRISVFHSRPNGSIQTCLSTRNSSPK